MKNVFTGESKNHRASNWEGVPFAVGIFHILFAASCEFRTVTRVWADDPDYAIEVFTPMLSAILIAVKGIRLWFWRHELYALLRGLAVMWEESHGRVEIRKKILASAEGTKRVGKYYGNMIIILVTNYALTPYIRLFQYYLYKNNMSEPYDYTVTVYPTTYPFATTTLTRYIICVTWEQFIFIFFVLYWMASDSLFAQLTTHTAIQYRILCHDLKNIAKSDDPTKSTNESERIRRLCVISQRHHYLYRCCRRIEKMFNPILFLMMLLTALNMCLCAFRLDKEVAQGNWSGVIKYLVHATTLIIQAVIYCGYAESLSRQML
nr:olfactory receptor 82 [Gregopimpla kuwanae]